MLILLAAVLTVAGCGTDATTPPAPDLRLSMVPAPCMNGFTDGDETDQDCGGPVCAPCDIGNACKEARDCVHGFCANGRCDALSCGDGVRDGQETDVDCGGVDCPSCANGQKCAFATDCMSSVCSGGVCQPPPLTCQPGTADCDADLANGCEAMTDSDAMHCGQCDHACPAQTPLCKKGLCEATIKVLIVHTVDNVDTMSDLVARLVATGAFVAVDTFDTSQQTGKVPDLPTLKRYQAVLVWSSGRLLDPNALGDKLADYYDAGGRVVVGFQYNDNGPAYCVGGRFGDPMSGYLLIECGDYRLDRDTLGVVKEPMSPLMNDVKKLDTMAGRNFAQVLHDGVVVAVWASGQPLVVRGTAKGRRRVDLNLWPGFRGGMNTDGWTGDGDKLLRNALLYQ